MSPIDQPAPSASPIRPAGATDVPWIGDFLRNRWGATTVAVHDEVIDAAQLPALVAEPRRGLATYRRLGGDAELVTLDAVPPGSGTGTALIEALTRKLSAEGCVRLWLTMTNANLSALQFYLRRGFRLTEVRPGAVDKARELKPSIPVVCEPRHSGPRRVRSVPRSRSRRAGCPRSAAMEGAAPRFDSRRAPGLRRGAPLHGPDPQRRRAKSVRDGAARTFPRPRPVAHSEPNERGEVLDDR